MARPSTPPTHKAILRPESPDLDAARLEERSEAVARRRRELEPEEVEVVEEVLDGPV